MNIRPGDELARVPHGHPKCIRPDCSEHSTLGSGLCTKHLLEAADASVECARRHLLQTIKDDERTPARALAETVKDAPEEIQRQAARFCIELGLVSLVMVDKDSVPSGDGADDSSR